MPDVWLEGSWVCGAGAQRCSGSVVWVAAAWGGLELEAALVSPQPCSPRCAEPAAAESSPRFSLRLVKPSLEAGPAGAAVAQRSHLGCSFPERGLSPRGARARLRGCLPTCAGQGKAPRVFSASRCEREPLAELKGE